eukprot:TRINITY_DN28967_c0_g1_i1.p1 TRINITY_DN28967_c0_g1~~TRINITY_DN28967_c0_g1_i1.p1  ORF type:complete len:205 (-),score=49.29 TRINITY_DN28967_c0_g1_i1:101-715(-)
MLDLGTLLGYFCIVACGVCKLPQIKTLYQSQVVGGLSLTSILLELYCHGCQTGFYISESYPPLEYLEYPLLVLQNFTLLFLVGVVSGSLFKSLQYITAFSTLIAVIGGGYFTKSTILMAMSLNIPIGVSAKLAQINAIRSAGSSDNVSYMAYLINFITGAARLYTHFMSRGETMVLANFAIMMCANMGVMGTISAFRGQKLKSS